MHWATVESEFDSQQAKGTLLLTTASRQALVPKQPPLQRLSELKWPDREANSSVLSSAEVKNAWSCNLISSYAFIAWCSATNRYDLTLTFYNVPLTEKTDYTSSV
jgi:hypothetical protein